MPVFDMGRTRRVSTKYQGRVGAPPAPTAEQQASAAQYQGSAKQRRDVAVTRARSGERARKAGPMQSAVVTFSGINGAGGGGGVATSNGETEKAWWENYWLWAGAAALWWISRRKKK